MIATIQPGSIHGTVAAPPSKSMAQRAYAAALLHRGTTVVRNTGPSADEAASLGIIQALGATVHTLAQQTNGLKDLQIDSTGVIHGPATIHCGESGLASRLFSPIAALGNAPIHITGGGSLLHRPLAGFAQAFAALGLGLQGFGGYLPFTVAGPMRPQTFELDASMGSQFLSGLLIALSHCATAPITITARGLTSRPYIDMTLEVLQVFGRHITHNHYEEFRIPAVAQHLPHRVELTVEGDWSSAAGLLVAGAIAGSVTVTGLNPQSTQADRGVLQALQAAGACINTAGNSITVAQGQLAAFQYDATHSPDLFPVLAALAIYCHGTSTITGLHRLVHKESNRAQSITDMLSGFGTEFSISGDTLCITGGQPQSATIHPANDHRLVMAAAIAALGAAGPVRVLQPEAAQKSYPGFFQDFISCGAVCSLNNG